MVLTLACNFRIEEMKRYGSGQAIWAASLKALVFVFSLGACTGKLDLEPRQSIDAGKALSDDRDFESAITGAYALIGDNSLYGTDLNMLPELLASENYCTWRGSFTNYADIASKNMTSNLITAENTWLQAYQAINIANNVLANRSRVKDEALRESLEGEALFLRGILHFELVRLYGLPYEAGTENSQPGVPVMTVPSDDEQSAGMKPARNTVEEAYAQVIQDLTAAAAKMPADNGTRATRFSALAFLSRVYLQMGDYPKALDAANEVIESRKYDLGASVSAVFGNKNSAESIFEIQQNEQNNAGTSNSGLATFYANLPGIGRGADIGPLATLLELYEPADQRRVTLFYPGDPGASPPVGNPSASVWASAKWTAYGQNIPVIRFAEMLLTRAECNLRLGSETGASPSADLNAVRDRAGASLISHPGLEDILQERILELCFEGLRIHDFKRTGRSTGEFAYNAPELVLPIPRRELDANDRLEQNEGY